MRRPRDYDAELKALDDKARHLKARKLLQLGELVIACRADALTPEQLAGALLAAADSDAATREVWRQRGMAHFLGDHRAGRGAADKRHDAAPDGRGAASA